MAMVGSIIEAQQFDRETLEEIFYTAELMEKDHGKSV
jgi:hypothetical protein